MAYPSEWTEELRESIRKRDNFRCQECQTPQDDSHRLAVHHIDRNKKNCDPSNLISLCKNCHSTQHIGPSEYSDEEEGPVRIAIAVNPEFIKLMDNLHGQFKSRSHAISVCATIGEQMLKSGNPEAFQVLMSLRGD